MEEGSPEEREQAQPHYIHWRHNGDKGHSLLLRMSCCTVAESASADVADVAADAAS